MTTNKNRLSVIVITRDRNILTQKTIESVHRNMKLFQNVDIYVCDNLSNPNPERISLFSKLLSNGDIKYYSYDTDTSLCSCFGKAIVIQRWIKMMQDQYIIRSLSEKENKLEDYYMILDNDVILGPNFDKYFLAANNALKEEEKDLHFFVKFIGGIPKASREHPETHIHNLECSDGEKFQVMAAVHGGGGCCWAFDYEKLCKLVWPAGALLNTYKKYKRQDTTAWNLIKRKYNKPVRYVGGIIPPDPENPLVLHIGETLKTSMCNVLTREGPAAYRRQKHNFELKELELKDMTAKEIYDKFKMLKSATEW